MTTKEIIQEYIANDLLQGTNSGSLKDDDLLIESGIIDSMGIMSLLSFLEEKFSLQIPGDDLIPENFASITRISDLVDRRLAN